MSEQGIILRDTLELVLAADDAFPRRFYEQLFAAHPEVEPMFRRNSPGAQRKMFAQKLAAIVDHFDEPEWLERELGGLARSHASYGVRNEMYAWVGDALLETVREACGAQWSDAAEQAWRAAYAQATAAILSAGGTD